MSLLDEAAKALLREPYFAWATVVRSDGRLHSTVVCVDVDGDDVVFTTAIGRVKEKVLRADARVSISVLDPNHAFHSVSVSGLARLEQEGADLVTDVIAKKYWGVTNYSHRSPDEQRVTVRVTPDNVIYSGLP
ncbi:TIGR03618 family F420-dependent PPOX class oxidoreductase [Nonomuraea sp. NPDC003804]|uniref:TIGR03618 family F420-dependent PPOX class oxidoreductase n=1 Tax=Nonomuraea sp. NPDC003804 TaxID=3154547 RepID=UPI0033B744F7